MECPFCLINSKIQAFATSPNFMAVYDISPILPGHSLIIPREHIESLHDLEPDKLAEFFQFAEEVTKRLCDYLDTEAFDWSLQEKEEAGQSVAHLHLHIIPRTKNDLPIPGDWYPLLMKHNEHTIIDDIDRPRFTDKEFIIVTDRLKKVFQV